MRNVVVIQLDHLPNKAAASSKLLLTPGRRLLDFCNPLKSGAFTFNCLPNFYVQNKSRIQLACATGGLISLNYPLVNSGGVPSRFYAVSVFHSGHQGKCNMFMYDYYWLPEVSLYGYLHGIVFLIGVQVVAVWFGGYLSGVCRFQPKPEVNTKQHNVRSCIKVLCWIRQSTFDCSPSGEKRI